MHHWYLSESFAALFFKPSSANLAVGETKYLAVDTLLVLLFRLLHLLLSMLLLLLC